MDIIKYYPEDLKEFYGTLGIKLPMNSSKAESNSGRFNMSRTTEDQAVSNYINLLFTRKGERYMQPLYGIGLQDRLFEPNTEQIRFEIEMDIRRESAIWLPYITNEKIEVKTGGNIPGLGSDSESGIQIVITFRVGESFANKTVAIFQSNGRVTYSVQ